MSEPVSDVPHQDKKPTIPRVHTHPKNLILQKVEILQSFTEEAINVLRLDIEAAKVEASKTTEARQENSNISDLLKALDETHQQFRNKLLRTVYQNKRQTSGNKEETEIFFSDSVSEAAESPHRTDDVKKFLFKLDDLSGSLASLDQPEEHSGGLTMIKPPSRAEPPGSPLPEMLHPHELEIIEEQNEADNVSENEESQETSQKEISKTETSQKETSKNETSSKETETPIKPEPPKN